MKKLFLIISTALLLTYIAYRGIEMYQFAKGVQADNFKNENHYDKVRLDYLENKNNLTITETQLGQIELNDLSGANIIENLQSEFKSSRINKGIGHQDGPDFILYSVIYEDKENIYVSMDSEDSTIMKSITILTSEIKDNYGLGVGMPTQKIIETRKNISFYADLHMNIYANEENSNIKYRLNGDLKSLNDSTYVSDNHSVEDWQVNEMKIEFIIWDKENGW